MSDDNDVRRTVALARQVQRELEKLGPPRDVLPAALLVILANARQEQGSLQEFLERVECFAKAFGVFEYD